MTYLGAMLYSYHVYPEKKGMEALPKRGYTSMEQYIERNSLKFVRYDWLQFLTNISCMGKKKTIVNLDDVRHVYCPFMVCPFKYEASWNSVS